jgi:hypothetical protein
MLTASLAMRGAGDEADVIWTGGARVVGMTTENAAPLAAIAAVIPAVCNAAFALT